VSGITIVGVERVGLCKKHGGTDNFDVCIDCSFEEKEKTKNKKTKEGD